MKFQEEKLVCTYISIYNLLKKMFLQKINGDFDPLFSIIEKILVLWGFFLAGGIIFHNANSTSRFYIRPLHYKIRNQF